VVVDVVRASMWFSLSAQAGSGLVSSNNPKLDQQMTKAQIAKAQAMTKLCLQSSYSDC